MTDVTRCIGPALLGQCDGRTKKDVCQPTCESWLTRMRSGGCSSNCVDRYKSRATSAYGVLKLHARSDTFLDVTLPLKTGSSAWASLLLKHFTGLFFTSPYQIPLGSTRIDWRTALGCACPSPYVRRGAPANGA